ncbi:signal recognition particle-docking protein FtsY [candidate division KSB1 bacterium]|nr:MAG: signal recognition particle-docking protein FtsY [candidate division KSB1 bacterium]
MKPVFEKFKTGLYKTRITLFCKLKDVISRGKKFNQEFIENIEEILIESDIGIETTMYLMDELKEQYRKNKNFDTSTVLGIIKKKLKEIMMECNTPEISERKQEKPYVILVVGVNGTGKTTTIGKLAYKYKKEGKSVLLSAADTFRAAAVEQLDIWRKRAGADIVKTKYGADPASVAYDSLQAAISRNIDVLIIDTAGRLHTKVNLMEELKKIKRILKKIKPSAPDETLLVLDAVTGQNSLTQAKEFNDAIGIDGIVLTKLDGTAKGGIIVPILKELKIPVKYVGMGEKVTDLALFDSETFINALICD